MNNEPVTIEVDGRMHDCAQPAITADDVLAVAGVVGPCVVIRIDGGRASHFAPEQPVAFPAHVRPAFRTFGDTIIRHLRVGGMLWDWGSPAITEDDVRSIAGIAEDVHIGVLGQNEPIRRGAVIDLTVPWPPQIEAQSVLRESGVPVVVNGREVVLKGPEVTFEDLVRLAFPGADVANPGSRALTVTYRRGPPDKPEGSLVAREAIRARQGEVFNVSATNKS